MKQIGGHHNQADFAVRGKEPKDEVQIYTWMDATLRELTDLVHTTIQWNGMMEGMELKIVVLIFCCCGFQVKEVAPEARRRDAMLSFAFVYPTKTGHFTVKEVTLLVFYNSKKHHLTFFTFITKENKFVVGWENLVLSECKTTR